MEVMDNTQLEKMYSGTTFTQNMPDSQALSETCSNVSQSGSQCGHSAPVSKLAATAQRLNEFAESLADPKNELDPFYQTVLKIYEFFDRKVPFLVILGIIHANAGVIPAAVQEVASHFEEACRASNDPGFFPFDQALVRRTENTAKYFEY